MHVPVSRRLFATIVASTLAAGCVARSNVHELPGPEPPRWGSRAWHEYLRRQSDSISQLDPARQADSAAAHGDLHLLAVNGFVLVVPGFNGDVAKYPYPIYVFPATSDAFEGEDHIHYSQVVADYAKAYNTVILAHVPQGRD